MRNAVRLLGLVFFAACATVQAAQPEKSGLDPVVLRFSTVGDARQDATGFDPSIGALSGQDLHWLQNTKALARILRGIEGQKSKLLFFNGDMIMGYGVAGPTPSNSVEDVLASDLMAFHTQYAYWRGMMATLMESGTYVIPVAGNHEVQSKSGGKKAVRENELAWRANMGDLILDVERFTSLVGVSPTHADLKNTGSWDKLPSDQSQLSYSFDTGQSHFAVINTDPVERDSTAPAAWLEQDFANARANGARHFFVFGHKPAYSYVFKADGKGKAEPDGLDKYPERRDAFWNVVEAYGATYFCGHQHIFNMAQPRGKAWQVMVGSGGSPFSAKPGIATQNPATDRAYAWATVDVHRSGRVDITAHGFDDQLGPTKVLQHVRLPH